LPEVSSLKLTVTDCAFALGGWWHTARNESIHQDSRPTTKLQHQHLSNQIFECNKYLT